MSSNLISATIITVSGVQLSDGAPLSVWFKEGKNSIIDKKVLLRTWRIERQAGNAVGSSRITIRKLLFQELLVLLRNRPIIFIVSCRRIYFKPSIMPVWRNGRRDKLKPCFSSGSSPETGTILDTNSNFYIFLSVI